MTDDLRQACEALVYKLTHVDTNWDCCLTSEITMSTLMAFARAHQAAGLKEAEARLRSINSDNANTTAELAALTAERDQLNNVLRQAGWGQGEIDSAAYTFDKLAQANAALIAERDRLKAALEACWRLTLNHKIQDPDAHDIIYHALRGETGGADGSR